MFYIHDATVIAMEQMRKTIDRAHDMLQRLEDGLAVGGEQQLTLP